MEKKRLMLSRYGSSTVTLLRLAVGAIFTIHGFMKLGLFGGSLQGTIGFFSSIGLPMPSVLAPLVGGIELLGGLLLILGLLVRWTAVVFAVQMAVTTLLHIFVMKTSFVGHWELDILLLTATLLLATKNK